MDCFSSLETVKFTPKLNIKETEETHRDFEKLKRRRGKKKEQLEEFDEAYYINLVEELNDFKDWCISDNNLWGIPIPFFTYKDTAKIFIDAETIQHFADLVENYGTSDIWYTFDIVDLLPKRHLEKADELQKGY
jgi:isoleucyl-tRNA synthetase